jgi:hypothetical protein
MDLLPSNVPAKNVVEYSAIDNTKGKKRAYTNDTGGYDGPSTPKKARPQSVQVSASDDVDMEIGNLNWQASN